MGTFSKNADGLLQHYGTKSVEFQAKHGPENTGIVEIFDDFVYSGAFEAASPWILNKDTSASDAAATTDAGGAVALVTGSVDNEGSQIVGKSSMTAAKGGLVMEARIKLAAVTSATVCVGFTDSQSIEEPFAVSGTTVTSTASDAVCFCYDTDATTDYWYGLGVDTDVDSTGNAITDVGPTAATYQTLRVEVDKDGVSARFYIDGALKNTITAGAVTKSTALYPTIAVHNRSAAANTLSVDYIYVAHRR